MKPSERCRYCGASIAENAALCIACGRHLKTDWSRPPGEETSKMPFVYQRPAGPRPKNYMAESVLATGLAAISSLCVPPVGLIGLGLGIAAIVYASHVDLNWSRGHIQEAARAAYHARLLTILSLLTAAIGIGLSIMLGVFFVWSLSGMNFG